MKEDRLSAAFKVEPSLTDLNVGRGMSVVFGGRWAGAGVVDHLAKVTVRLEPVGVCQCDCRMVSRKPLQSSRKFAAFMDSTNSMRGPG